MRTIRINLFKLHELPQYLQGLAILDEAKRMEILFTDKWKGYATEPQIRQAKEYLIKYKCEFTKKGKLFRED